MQTEKKEPPLIELRGQVEHITYSDPESGYSVVRLKVEGRGHPVMAVGSLADPVPGQILSMRGHWVTHPTYGPQFKVVSYTTGVPATVAGIVRYLGSGMIRGIGPKMAARIVKHFGDQTLTVIDGDIARLGEVEGIGQKRIAMIRQAWREQAHIRDVMIFLQGHGVSPAFAVRIFKQYGSRAIAAVRENPYRLAADIAGVGFVTADRIAQQLGVARDSAQRIRAGVLYVLNRLADEGHVYYPDGLLAAKCCEILEVTRGAVMSAFEQLALQKRIVIEDWDAGSARAGSSRRAIYLSKFYVCEVHVAARLKRLLQAPASVRPVDGRRLAGWLRQRLGFELAAKQMQAVRCALSENVLVITGGPGTGKTTIIRAVLSVFEALKAKVLLAAPTGRAAKRLSEAAAHPAKTIHRLLAFSFQKGGFQKNDRHPLNCNLLVVDEASMIDTVLMHHLLKAVSPGTVLVLVGDVNQLPSVGPGSILSDMIRSKVVPVVTLDRIFRQAQASRIVVNAHRINAGKMPQTDTPADAQRTDFYFIERADPQQVCDLIVAFVKDRIPQRFGFDAGRDIQVLTPMHRGVVGAANLNRSLQAALNPASRNLACGGGGFRIGDKVMQIRNNYEKEVFNGDIGRIIQLKAESRQLLIRFEERLVPYDFYELDEIVLAYAISIHKSQGSEYPAVVVPILTQHYVLLQRNLVYTAITRARRLAVVVGTRKALGIAVGNDKTQRRFTLLDQRLQGRLPSGAPAASSATGKSI